MEEGDGAPARSEQGRSAASSVWILGLIVAYVVTGRLGLQLATYERNATLIWAPSGLAVAAVWLLGRRMAIGVWFGSLIVNLAIGSPIALAISIAFGSTCEALIAGELARRARIDREWKSTRDVLVFSALLVGAATALGASFGACSLAMFGGIPLVRLPATWAIWWLGDAGGVLVVTPLFIAFTRREAKVDTGRTGELLLLVVASALSLALAFGGLL